MADRTRTLAVESELWEEYRLHQRDVLLECVRDAELLLKRMKSETPPVTGA